MLIYVYNMLRSSLSIEMFLLFSKLFGKCQFSTFTVFSQSEPTWDHTDNFTILFTEKQHPLGF